MLKFITFTHISFKENMLTYINDLAIKGLKKMRITYENDKKSGSLIINCIDDYIKTLTTIYSVDEYTAEVVNISARIMLTTVLPLLPV